MNRISRVWSVMMRESAIGAWFSRKTMEGWMGRRPFYMLRNGMYKILIRRRWQSVGIWLRLLTRMGRSYSLSSSMTMWLRRGVENEEIGQ